MKYSLSTGKVVDLTFEQWYNMTDEQEQALVANDAGSYIELPFSNSLAFTDDLPEVDEESIKLIVKDINELSFEEKLSDIDLDTQCLSDD